MTERNIRMRRGTERARAITAMKKRKAAKNRNIVIVAVAGILAVAIVVGVGVLGTSLIKNNNQPAAPTTVTKLAMTDPTTQAGSATQAPTDAPAKQNTPAQNNNTAVSDNNTGSSDTQQQAQAATEASKSDDKPYSGGVSSDGIIYDQRHEVPKGTGTPLHYYATGKTSGGYDWDYTADNSNVSVCCNYNTNTNQYDYILYGRAQGTTHMTLYYYADDNTKVPVSLTLNVDKDLNVTQA